MIEYIRVPARCKHESLCFDVLLLVLCASIYLFSIACTSYVNVATCMYGAGSVQGCVADVFQDVVSDA